MRTAQELKGKMNCTGELYRNVAKSVLSELKAFGGTVLLLAGRSTTEGYFQASDNGAPKSE